MNVFYSVPATQPMELVLAANDPLVYRKELIYCGSFHKKTQSEDIRFDVDETVLQHWHNTFLAMSANGVEVPVPIEHTTDLTKKRGKLIKTEIALNKKGIPALFGYIRFNDEKSVAECKNANTSIFVPNEITDGKSNKYHRPMQHIALTDYPIIPGLESFQAIAASLVEKPSMSLKSIAEKLKIDGADKLEDAKLESAISAAIDELLKKIDAAASNPPNLAPAPEVKKEGENHPANPPVVSASHISMLRDNRTIKLDALVKAGAITPAVKDELAKQHCNDKTLSLALSATDATVPDSFDTLLKTLAMNNPVLLREQTGPQNSTIALSQLDEKDNPILKNAEKRRKEAQEAAAR